MRTIIGAALVQGASAAKIARDIGVSPSWVFRQARHRATREQISQLLYQNRKTVMQVSRTCLNMIESFFNPYERNRQINDALNVDRSQLKAASKLLNLLNALKIYGVIPE